MLRFANSFTLLVTAGVASAAHPMQTLYNSGGAYPAAFPFDIGPGFDVPGFSMEHEPQNLTKEPDTDNGGYCYYGLLTADMNDWADKFAEHGMWTFNANGIWNYMFANEYGKPDGLPLSAWNCSKFIQKAAGYTGLVNTKRVCATGECCKDVVGLHRRDDDYEKWHLKLDIAVSGGMCGDITETMYCQNTYGNAQMGCIQHYRGTSKRVYPLTNCWDANFLYYNSCPVYKVGGLPLQANTEPPAYISKMVATDFTIYKPLQENPDRICLPMSYFESTEVPSDDDSGGIIASITLVALLM